MSEALQYEDTDDQALLEQMADEYEGEFKGRVAEIVLQAVSEEEVST